MLPLRASGAQPEGLGGELVDQDAGHHGVEHAEGDTRPTEH